MGCFAVFCQKSDLMLTGNRAMIYWEYPFQDFYDVSRELRGNYGANYMPSTFWLYALWNLPLYLLRGLPADLASGSYIRMLWYKLLPTLFYVASGYLMYLNAKEFGFGEKKSKICAFAFVTAPVAFFSQFIFGQYDVFTVFFVLLGLYFYQKDRLLPFTLCFGIAITFKYFAAVVFLVFLFVREKRILQILKYAVLVAIPFALEYLIYAGSTGFTRGVFGFNALTYVEAGSLDLHYVRLQIMPLAVCVIVAWSYFAKASSMTEQMRWGVFLSSGICFAFFGLSMAHPQWLIFAVPFWVLSTFDSENTTIFLWLDLFFAAVYYCFIWCYFRSMFGPMDVFNGLLGEIWPYQNQNMRWSLGSLISLDTNLLYTVMAALMLIFFVFKHPSHTNRQINQWSAENTWLVRGRFIGSVLLYVIPCLISFVMVARSSVSVWTGAENNDGVLPLSSGTVIEQTFHADADEIDLIEIPVWTYGHKNETVLSVEIYDQQSGQLIVSQTEDLYNQRDGQTLRIAFNSVEIEAGHDYSICFSAENVKDDDRVALGFNSTGDEKQETELFVGNDLISGDLVMTVYGK